LFWSLQNACNTFAAGLRGSEYIVFRNWEKNRDISFDLIALDSSSADGARELFKPLKDSACLRVCNEKKIFGFVFFCE